MSYVYILKAIPFCCLGSRIVLLSILTLLSAFIHHILDIPTILDDAGVDAIEPSYNEKDPNLYEVSTKYI